MSLAYPQLLTDKKLTPPHIYVAGTIELRLTRDDCQAFEIRRSLKDGREYYYVEYDVVLNVDGWRLTYEFVVPRKGKFVDGGPGRNPIRKTCELSLAPAIQFYDKPEAHTSPSPTSTSH